MAEDKHRHESGAAENRDLRRRKRRRCLVCILLFLALQAVIILILALTVMRTRTPTFRVSAAAFGAIDYSSAAANPSFDIQLFAQLSVRNRNFGRYKFDSTTIYFLYNGAVVGSALVPSWRALARSTRVIDVEVELSSTGSQVDRVQLASDLEAGVLPVNSRSTLEGEVEVLQVLRREKTAELECFIAVNLAPRTLAYLSCD